MSLEMRQRLSIGSASDLMGKKKALRAENVFPYVRRVTLDEDRMLPVAILNAVIPPYPAEMMEMVKIGNVIRWEAGYWEDGIKALLDESNGYHLEFEGVITSVSEQGRYEGADPDKLMRRGDYQDSLSIEIEARDYMFVLNSTQATHPYFKEDEIVNIVNEMITMGSNDKIYGLTCKQMFDAQKVNQSKTELDVTGHLTVGYGLYLLRNTDTSIVPEANGNHRQLGIDTYFRGKELQLRDPNDTQFLNGEYRVFVYGWNIISANISPRTGKLIQVIARFYDPKIGSYSKSKPYPPEGHPVYQKAKDAFQGQKPVIVEYEVQGDAQGNMPNLEKYAENIYVRIAGDGLVGKFLTFGYPPVHRGDIIIYAGKEQDTQKAVLVDHVMKTYDAENATFRQEISPGFTPSPIINKQVKDASTITDVETLKTKSEYQQDLKNRVDSILESIRSGGGK